MAATTLDDVDVHLRAIISNLYNLTVQTHAFQRDSQPRNFATEIKQLIRNLVDLTQAARRLPDHIPIELIEYIESTRNPDIYTREFVELVMRYNQQQKGRIEAFASFRDILAEQMMVGIPDIREDVKTVLIASGGRAD
ncbi:RNA polymerase II mediator complex subunit [Extremus antarcticus]|uniref:Mediator of RNA polymerase II transcription subunit 10 n=1 Tax=Extremus antarcticus TaxID=702011 RepID=A0AAJ0DSA4_9PEZI|nr:RNA polymerase II mediator complex subunit [Extremus antarcticus]